MFFSGGWPRRARKGILVRVGGAECAFLSTQGPKAYFRYTGRAPTAVSAARHVVGLFLGEAACVDEIA
jgi:hypothetical protein